MLSYDDFIFIKDEQGYYKRVDCTKNKHITWKKYTEWTEYNKDDTIIVFDYQGKVLGDTFFFTLAITTKENFEKRFTESFDFDKICKIGGDFTSFLGAQEFLINTFGYKKENIFDDSGNINRKYNLGIFNSF